MYCKAILICEDVRLDMNGTMTLIGVHSERLIARRGTGPMQVPSLRFLTIVGGLRGAESLKYRHQLLSPGEKERNDLPFVDEKHEPAADEHNFVFGEGTIMFPREGGYEFITELEAGGQRIAFRYRFEIMRPK
jgi:hypothetical protein